MNPRLRRLSALGLALAAIGLSARPSLARKGDVYTNDSGKCDPGDGKAPHGSGFKCIDDHAPYFPILATGGAQGRVVKRAQPATLAKPSPSSSAALSHPAR